MKLKCKYVFNCFFYWSFRRHLEGFFSFNHLTHKKITVIKSKRETNLVMYTILHYLLLFLRYSPLWFNLILKDRRYYYHRFIRRTEWCNKQFLVLFNLWDIDQSYILLNWSFSWLWFKKNILFFSCQKSIVY